MRERARKDKWGKRRDGEKFVQREIKWQENKLYEKRVEWRGMWENRRKNKQYGVERRRKERGKGPNGKSIMRPTRKRRKVSGESKKEESEEERDKESKLRETGKRGWRETK